MSNNYTSQACDRSFLRGQHELILPDIPYLNFVLDSFLTTDPACFFISGRIKVVCLRSFLVIHSADWSLLCTKNEDNKNNFCILDLYQLNFQLHAKGHRTIRTSSVCSFLICSMMIPKDSENAWQTSWPVTVVAVCIASVHMFIFKIRVRLSCSGP